MELILLVVSVCWLRSAAPHSVLNGFVDAYLDRVRTEEIRGVRCVQAVPPRVLDAVGRSSHRIITSDARVSFLCSSERDGDVLVRQDGELVTFEAALLVRKISFDLDSVQIVSPSGRHGSNRVEFETEGRVRVSVGLRQGGPGALCTTSPDVQVSHLDDFTCRVSGPNNRTLRHCINSKMKKRFSDFMRRQYSKLLDGLDICHALMSSFLKNDNQAPLVIRNDIINNIFDDD